MKPQNAQNTQIDVNADRINLLSKRIISRALTVLHRLGTGFLEKVYHKVLSHEQGKAGLADSQQQPIVFEYEGIVGGDYAADLLVEGFVPRELKMARAIG